MRRATLGFSRATRTRTRGNPYPLTRVGVSRGTGRGFVTPPSHQCDILVTSLVNDDSEPTKATTVYHHCGKSNNTRTSAATSTRHNQTTHDTRTYTHTCLRLPRHQHEATTPPSNATQKRPKHRSVPSSGPPAPSIIKGEHPDRLTGGSETRLGF